MWKLLPATACVASQEAGLPSNNLFDHLHKGWRPVVVILALAYAHVDYYPEVGQC
jgi:hypothetical protein